VFVSAQFLCKSYENSNSYISLWKILNNFERNWVLATKSNFLVFLFFAYICYIIGWTPDDANVCGEIYWEENDIILVLESRGWDLFKNDLKYICKLMV